MWDTEWQVSRWTCKVAAVKRLKMETTFVAGVGVLCAGRGKYSLMMISSRNVVKRKFTFD